MSIEVTGIKAAQNALTAALKDVNVESEILVNQILQGISLHTAPYIPVDTSFLINSEYRTTRMERDGVLGEIGYTAEYAKYVHEGPQKNWQKSGASNRFLELGTKDFIADDLSSLLARFAR